jgi:hypothetical protein
LRKRPSLKEPQAEANLHWIVSRAFTSGSQCQPEEVEMIVKLAQQEFNDCHLYQEPGIFVTSLYARAAYRQALLETLVDTFERDLFDTDVAREFEAKRPYYLRDKTMVRYAHLVSHQQENPEQRHIIEVAMKEYIQDAHPTLFGYVLEEIDMFGRRMALGREILRMLSTDEEKIAAAKEIKHLLAYLAEGRGLNYEAIEAAQIGRDL